MKIKTIVLCWIFMSFTQVVFSQITYGIQGGISFFRTTNFESTGSYNNPELLDRFADGYYIALTSDIPIKNNFSIQGELSFIRKGNKQVRIDDFQNIPLFENSWIQELRYHYLEVPIIGKYKFNLSENFGLHVGIGASFGYLLKAKQWNKEDNTISSETIEIPNGFVNGVKVNKWDIAPLVDISFPTKAKFGNFNVGFRGSFDLSKYHEYNSPQPSGNSGKRYNWGMMTYLGYSFSKNNFKKNRNS